MARNKSGINALAYRGVQATTPPQFLRINRAPKSTDYREYRVGTLWLDYSNSDAQVLYILASKSGHVSTWLELSTSTDIVGGDGEILIGDSNGTSKWTTLTAGSNVTITNGPSSITIESVGGGGGGADDFVTDSGTASTIGTEINIIGGNVLNTTGASNTVEIELDNGADGEVLIGGGSNPTWGTITAGTGISVTNGSNSILIEATGAEPGDLPVGSILRYDVTPAADPSWALCDGSAVSQTTYSTLYGLVGHEYMYPTYATQSTNNSYNNIIVHNQLAGAEGLWVAVGTGISHSPDGTTWTAATSPFSATNIRSVAHNGQSGVNGLWVAINGNLTNINDLIATSPDGVTWTLRSVAMTSGYYLQSIAHNQKASPNGLWVAAAIMGVAGVFTSTDGITWTAGPTSSNIRSNDAAAKLYGVCFNESADVFGLITTDKSFNYGSPHVYYNATPDSTEWTQSFSYDAHTYDGGSPKLSGIAIGNNRFVITGEPHYSYVTPQIFVSDSGKCFMTSGTSLVFGGSNSFIVAIGGDDDYTYIGINPPTYSGLTKKIYYSSDGLNWDVYPHATGGLLSQGMTSMTSNNYAHPDRVNIINGGSTIQVGQASINAATHFYLPNIENRIIRIL